MLRDEAHASGGPALTGANEASPSPVPAVLRVAAIEVSSPKGDLDDAAREFGAWVRDTGFGKPFVVSSKHGAHLARAVQGSSGAVSPPGGSNQSWVVHLVDEVRRSEAESIVAIGGGRCLDLAKLTAARCELPLVVVPTQLSHDGMCSPVSVVPNADGVTQSLPAVVPMAAFFSIPTLARSPIRSLRAGVGDLLSNPFALRDWELAATMGFETMSDAAWHLAMESTEMIEQHLDHLDDARIRSPRFLGLLSHALANSGVAMMLAGSSRPASGAEHKISHAIDLTYGGRALHGEQVAFACLVSAALHGLAVAPLSELLRRLELPHHPRDLGLSNAELGNLIAAAPATRPGRYTVLEKYGLDELAAKAVVDDLWPEGR